MRNTDEHSLEVDALVRALSTRAQLTRQLHSALERGDDTRARTLLEELEQENQRLSRSIGWLRRQPSLIAQEIQRGVAALLRGVEEADAQMRARLQELGASSVAEWVSSRRSAVEKKVDELLASPWDLTRDLLVVSDAPGSDLVRALRARGQERILFVESTTASDEPGAIDERAVSNLAQLDAACWALGWPPPDQVRLAVTSEASRLDARELGEKLRQTLTTMSLFRDALERQGKTFLSASVRNLAAVARLPSVVALDQAFSGRPAILVAAGPSLDKNIAQLVEARSKAVIIAISQALPALLKAGVTPHIVLTVDPLNMSYHFEGLEHGASALPALGLGASVAPSLFRMPAERVFTLAASPAVERWIYELLGEDAHLPSGGTVAHTALQLALKLGCSPIIAVGQDFALDGRKYYADRAADGGAPLEIDGDSLNTRNLPNRARLAEGMPELYDALLHNPRWKLTTVKGWHGGEVSTTVDLLQHLTAYRSMCLAAGGRARLINATEGGAYLEGMEHLPLAQVLAGLEPLSIDVRQVLHERLTLEDPERRRERMRGQLAVVARRLEKARQLAKGCARDLSRGRPLTKRVRDFRQVADSLPFLAVWAAGEVRRMLEHAHDATAGKELDTAELALYRATEEAARALLPYFEAALKELSAPSASAYAESA